MYRKLAPLDPKVEKLLEERDDLQIQISLVSDGEKPDADRLHAMHKRIAQIEGEIAAFRRLTG